MRTRIRRSRACFRNKSKLPDKLVAKARVVALGHLDPDLHRISRDSPMPSRTSEYVLLAVYAAGVNGQLQNSPTKWLLWSGDASTAFLQGEPEPGERPADLLLRPPQDEVCRLAGIFQCPLYRVKGNIYGLASAPRTWAREVTRRLLSAGYRQHALDRMMFYKHRQRNGRSELCCMMIVYVDDFLVTCAQDYDKTELTDLFEWGCQKEFPNRWTSKARSSRCRRRARTLS